jgi:hypothetical protein
MVEDELDDTTSAIAKIAWDLIEKYSPDGFNEAWEKFSEEMRARYIREDDGDFDAYMQRCCEIFENEWNDETNHPTARHN